MESPPGALDVAAPWRIRMLGTFKAERSGLAAPFRTKKTASLLAYLVYYAGLAVSKELLVEALWPESNAEKGRQSLRMAVSSLRASLAATGWDPAAYILSERDTLEVSSAGFATDVQEFRDHISRADSISDPKRKVRELRLGLELYSGGFLPGFGDEWILPQALELEEMFAQAACKLVDLTARQGDIQGAVAAGRHALAICSSREDLHIALMRAYARAGQAASAIKQYEELEKMLDDQWGETPSEEAVSVLESLPKHASAISDEAVIQAADIEPPAEKKALTPERTAFFGRESEIASLIELLSSGQSRIRLVTLSGLGGSGKTRLAQRIVERLSEPLCGRAWFVSLVGIEKAADFDEAILKALGIGGSKKLDLLEAIGASLGPDDSLLVLDNLEQIVPAAKARIESLLEHSNGLRILATSRVPIEASGERLFPLPPLPLPADYKNLAALRATPSVQLLVDAAQAVRPGFSVTPANAQSIYLLCQRLEGIPLAIELAAAKLATLTPAQVIAAIGRRVDLSTAQEAVPIRHRSLENVVKWSLDLLREDERKAFARLSVCRGGFNAELAARLIEVPTEDMLAKFCKCSLLGWSETNDAVRFEMLETVREISSLVLQEDPQALAEATRKQFDFVRALTTNYSHASSEDDRADWIARMDVETGNVLASLDAASKGAADAESSWQMALPLQFFIERRGRPQQWVEPLAELLRSTESELSPTTSAKAHLLIGRSYYLLREIRSTFNHFLKAIEASDASGDVTLQIECRTEIVSSAITIGDFDKAQEVLEKAVELLSLGDDTKAAAVCYLNLAWVVFDRGQEENSEPLFLQACELAEASGDVPTLAASLTGYACGVGHFRYEDSQPVFDRAIELWNTASMPGLLAHSLYYRALIDYRHGHFDVALEYLERSMHTFVSNGISFGQTILTISGNLMAALERFEDAAACWGSGNAARRRHSMQIIPTVQRDFDREFPKAKAAMSAVQLDHAHKVGGEMTDEALMEKIFGSVAAPL